MVVEIQGFYTVLMKEKILNMQIYRKLRTKLEELGYKGSHLSRDSDIDVDFVTGTFSYG